MFGLGFGELILVFLIALIFIGPKKLPELAKGLGKGIREFQDAAKGMKDQIEQSIEEDKKVEAKPQAIAEHAINQAPTINAEHKNTDSETEKKA